MRLRLVHTLALTLLGAVAVSVLAMGALTAWHLREGFSTYVQARDLERLDTLVRVATEWLEAAGGPAALAEQRPSMSALLREAARRDGVGIGPWEGPPGPPPDGPRGPRGFGPSREGPPFDAAPRDGPHREGPRRDGPRREGPPRDGPPRDDGRRPPRDDAFGDRVTIVDPEGRALLGRVLLPGNLPFVERPIRWRGQVVAIARLRPVERVPDEHEVRFLRSQYVGIAVLAAALIALSVAVAGVLARRWARRLVEVQAVTARIARGELGVRGPVTLDDEIGDVMRNVNAMAESLQRLEGARRRWVADLSHELRTPLSVLRAELEAMLDGVRPIERGGLVSLREEVLRLGALIDDLHLLAMSDLNAMPCRRAEADAGAIARAAVARFDTRAIAAGLGLVIDDDHGASMPVFWDEARVGQLLSNLLENALRYTDAPGPIRVVVRGEVDRVVLIVEDGPPGVGDAELPRLFEPLYRAEAARDRDSGGSGLGLAICEAIVRSHGGTIRALRSPLGGLRVEAVLPAGDEPVTPKETR